MAETRSVVGARLIFGLLLAAFGVVFTLDNFGALDASEVLRFWPLAIVAWGVACLMGLGCERRPLMGSLIVIAGVYMQALALRGGWMSSFDLGPLVLVLIGVYLIAGPALRRGRSPLVIGAVVGRRGRAVRVDLQDAMERGFTRTVDEAAAAQSSGDEVNALAVLGSVSRKCVSTAFTGGEVTAVLGGAVVDLREAKIAGDRATLEVVTVMGGVELLVPDGWRIQSEVASILGSFEDKTRVAPAGATTTLQVTGMALLGSVEVKH